MDILGQARNVFIRHASEDGIDTVINHYARKYTVYILDQLVPSLGLVAPWSSRLAFVFVSLFQARRPTVVEVLLR